MIIRDVVLD